MMFLVLATNSSHQKIEYLHDCLHELVNSLPFLTFLMCKYSELNKSDEKNNNKSENNTAAASAAKPPELEDLGGQGETFTNSVYKQLQYALRLLAKLCLCTKNSSDIAEEYKLCYSQTLRINAQNKWPSVLQDLIAILWKVSQIFESPAFYCL